MHDYRNRHKSADYLKPQVVTLENQPFYREEKKWSFRFILLFVLAMFVWGIALGALIAFGLPVALSVAGVLTVSCLAAIYMV